MEFKLTDKMMKLDAPSHSAKLVISFNCKTILKFIGEKHSF